MSFVPNSAQQISLFDKLAFLSKRKQKMIEKSWAQAFSDHIFTRINEHIFAPLYSEKTNSRPNAPDQCRYRSPDSEGFHESYG